MLKDQLNLVSSSYYFFNHEIFINPLRNRRTLHKAVQVELPEWLSEVYKDFSSDIAPQGQ